mmetsp:Transcript_20330/g.48000  ORF Transcript_20330/g.48000 Transcript_20330/m.48000 type:complete len:470 (+) Transcript_20330:43-1452(+)
MSLIYSKTGRARSPSLALTTTATITAMTAGLVLAMYRGGYHQRFLRFLRMIPPKIYDVVILNMTEVWYRTVFSRLPDGTAVLDVGIGTGGALCRCADLVRSKHLRIIGLDYDAAYVDAARQSIADVGLQDQVRVVCMSVYDEEKLYRLGDIMLDRMNGADDIGDGLDILTSEPFIPTADGAKTCNGRMTDKTIDNRVGHHHPHLKVRDGVGRDDAVINRTNSEALSEGNSEAEREHVLHDLLEHNNAAASTPGCPDLKRMNTPMHPAGGDDDDETARNRSPHTPKAPAGIHDAQHPQTAHDYSPPATPGRDHNIHWDKELPMPWHLDASGGDADKKIEAMAQAAAARATRPRKAFGAVYFSGSFSLLPDPPAALRLTSKVLADHGKIYITQTFQRRTLPLLNVIKPWIYFVTSIDFGQLISTSKIIDLYKEVEEDLELESHTPIEGSVDTVLQGAYMSVLRHSAEEDAI